MTHYGCNNNGWIFYIMDEKWKAMSWISNLCEWKLDNDEWKMIIHGVHNHDVSMNFFGCHAW